MLATDGAYNTLRHLGHADGRRLAEASAAHLSDLLTTCQRWEAEHDPDGNDLPRSKRHDDKSLATITL